MDDKRLADIIGLHAVAMHHGGPLYKAELQRTAAPLNIVSF
jgi:hypothetical protein